MNSFYQDVQLKDVEMDNKELVQFYGHSMRAVRNLKVIKMSHTKYQANRYFSSNQYSKSLAQLLSSSRILIKFRETLLFTLKQLYLKQEGLLTVLQWMSPPFDCKSKRTADQDLIQQLNRRKIKFGNIIYIIEIERILKVFQFDHKEITLKLLFELSNTMGCLAKLDREYIFYDDFFMQLNHYFRDDKPEFINPKEQEIRHKFEERFAKNQKGLRKIGVVNDYTDVVTLGEEMYDSVSNLIYAKGDDYMFYSFMGFIYSPKEPAQINATYCNVNTKSKLHLRNISICTQVQKKSATFISRNLSGLGSKYKSEIGIHRENQGILKRNSVNAQQQHFPRYLVESFNEVEYGSVTMTEGEEDNIPVQSIPAYECDYAPFTEPTLRGKAFPPIDDIPYQEKHYFKIAKGSSWFGIAKPNMLTEESESGDDEEFDCDDKPLELDVKAQEKQNISKEKGWKGVYGRKQSAKKDTKTVNQKDEPIQKVLIVDEEDREAQQLIKNLSVPYENRTIDFQIAEYEAEIGQDDDPLDLNDRIELDLRQFGFAESMLIQIYSNQELRALRISFPDSQKSLPVILFPALIAQATYNLHSWRVSPIDNIKGFQLQKKRVNGVDFIQNFVFLAQDDARCPLQCDFEFSQNQPIYDAPQLIIPPINTKWRQGQFRMNLNFDLNNLKNQKEQEVVIQLLKKLNSIFQQMFPGLIVEENTKKIKPKCVFEIFLQGMGRPKLRDNYDRYYLISVENWHRFQQSFDSVVTDLIDNLTLLIWSYGGITQIHQMELEISKRSTGTITKNYPYKFVSS